jgi:hypothetical protein
MNADKLPKTIDDLLTDEQREQLYADLAKMAKQRRMAEDAAANIPMA